MKLDTGDINVWSGIGTINFLSKAPYSKLHLLCGVFDGLYDVVVPGSATKVA